jgi:hypothetical protein
MRWTRKEPEEWESSKPKRARFVTWYARREGVFPSPSNNGKWVARVRKGKHKNFTTISQHDTEKEAHIAYLDFYK